MSRRIGIEQRRKGIEKRSEEIEEGQRRRKRD
jgi:hypothetical protein